MTADLAESTEIMIVFGRDLPELPGATNKKRLCRATAAMRRKCKTRVGASVVKKKIDARLDTLSHPQSSKLKSVLTIPYCALPPKALQIPK